MIFLGRSSEGLQPISKGKIEALKHVKCSYLRAHTSVRANMYYLSSDTKFSPSQSRETLPLSFADPYRSRSPVLPFLLVQTTGLFARDSPVRVAATTHGKSFLSLNGTSWLPVMTQYRGLQLPPICTFLHVQANP